MLNLSFLNGMILLEIALENLLGITLCSLWHMCLKREERRSKTMKGSPIVLCSLADEELLAAIRDCGFELFKDITEVPVKEVENIQIILGWGRRKGEFKKNVKSIFRTIKLCRDEWI